MAIIIIADSIQEALEAAQKLGDVPSKPKNHKKNPYHNGVQGRGRVYNLKGKLEIERLCREYDKARRNGHYIRARKILKEAMNIEGLEMTKKAFEQQIYHYRRR